MVLIIAAVYCCFLGYHWLPLDYSDKELAAFISRLWDIKQELVVHHRLPWWTPNYMSGSSYALHHSQGLYLIPSLALSIFLSFHHAVKVVALLAIFLSAITMYFCARHFMKNEWAAALASAAFLFHPEMIIRAAGAEHLGIILFFPFVPLSWLCFARVMECKDRRYIIWCSLSLVGLLWSHNKMAFVQCLFLFCYAIYWFIQNKAKSLWIPALKQCAVMSCVFLTLSAPLIVPGLAETRFVKLFQGDPMEAWQQTYSLKSFLGLVDRNGIIASNTIARVQKQIETNYYRPGSENEAKELKKNILQVFSLQTESPEKYAGIVALAIIGITLLFGKQTVTRKAFYLFLTFFLLSISLSYGMLTVGRSNWRILNALFVLEGIPSYTRLICLTVLVFGIISILVFLIKQLSTINTRIIAIIVMIIFLFFPSFHLLSLIPFFKEIRAPSVFYDVHGAFFGALLAGFFVTEVLFTSLFKKYAKQIILGVSVFMVIDYWPYHKPAMKNDVSSQTLKNLRSTYNEFQTDPDWVKTYSISGRYFHLLGPMYGGKPQIYEAFYNWMCPIGMGVLNQSASSSWEYHTAFLDLMGARYIVFDKSDPSNAQSGSQQLLEAYRSIYPVQSENEDFVTFKNKTTARYLTAYNRFGYYVGDLVQAGQLALRLAKHNIPLLHLKPNEVTTLNEKEVRQCLAIYIDRTISRQLTNVPPHVRRKFLYVDKGISPPLPNIAGEIIPLSKVQLTRFHNGLMRLAFDVSELCTLVISESYYPYWKAKVNNENIEIRRISCGLMGVTLEPGSYELDLQYNIPFSYWLSGGISIIGIFGGVFFVLLDKTNKKV